MTIGDMVAESDGYCFNLSYFSIVNLNTLAISFPSAGIFKSFKVKTITLLIAFILFIFLTHTIQYSSVPLIQVPKN